MIIENTLRSTWLSKHLYAVALIFILALVMGRLARNNFIPSYFILAGAENIDESQLADPSIYLFNHQGYDGQYFYRYAINPWSIRQDEYGIHVDSPNYRKQRIVYPLIVWSLSMGNVKAIPWIMILVNIMALFWIVVMGSKILKLWKLPKGYALLPLLFSGLIFALSRNLSEAVEGAFLVTAIYFGVQRKMGWYALFASITVLSKETSLLLFGAYSILLIVERFTQKVDRNKWFNDLIFSGYPLLFLVLWKWITKKTLLAPTLFNGSENLSLVPFEGLLAGWQKTMQSIHGHVGITEAVVWHLSVIWLFYLGFLVAKNIKAFQVHPAVCWLGLGALMWMLFSIFFTHKIWEDDWSFMRVFSSFCLVSVFFLFFRRIKWPSAFLIGTFAIFGINLIRVWLNQ